MLTVITKKFDSIALNPANSIKFEISRCCSADSAEMRNSVLCHGAESLSAQKVPKLLKPHRNEESRRLLVGRGR